MQFRLFLCTYMVTEKYQNYQVGEILNHLNYMSKKSEEMIAEQQNTNQELNMLRNQMANANSMQQQMLQNQIREIEEKEIQKFYKLRSFKLNQLTTCIDNLTDINQKAFTYYVFKDIITERATEAQSNLNEINDKEYCNSTLAKLRGIYQQIGDIRQVSIAEYLMRFINSKAEYDKLCNALSDAKAALKTAPPMVPGRPANCSAPLRFLRLQKSTKAAIGRPHWQVTITEPSGVLSSGS